MPFTPTHIAAVLPIAHYCRWFPLSALAIGSMIPDLPLFFRSIHYAQTHTISGLFLYCMPLGLVAYMLFQCVLKIPLIALLPNRLQERLAKHARPYLKPSYLFFVGVAAALVVGAATHIVWDAFTHQGRWGTKLIPLLNYQLPPLAGYDLPGYKAFQYGSTFIFLPLMFWLAVRQLIYTPIEKFPALLHLSATTKSIVSTILLLAPCLLTIPKVLQQTALPPMVFVAITSTGAIFAILVLVYALLFHAVVYIRGASSV